jgi:hypothetical protein
MKTPEGKETTHEKLKRAWETRRIRYGVNGLSQTDFKSRSQRLKKHRIGHLKGVPITVETRKKISDTIKQQWKDGKYENAKKCFFSSERNEKLRKEHTKKLVELKAFLQSQGHTIIFCDLPKHERPDLIAGKDGTVFSYDVKINREAEIQTFHLTAQEVKVGG